MGCPLGGPLHFWWLLVGGGSRVAPAESVSVPHQRGGRNRAVASGKTADFLGLRRVDAACGRAVRKKQPIPAPHWRRRNLPDRCRWFLHEARTVADEMAGVSAEAPAVDVPNWCCQRTAGRCRIGKAGIASRQDRRLGSEPSGQQGASRPAGPAVIMESSHDARHTA